MTRIQAAHQRVGETKGESFIANSGRDQTLSRQAFALVPRSSDLAVHATRQKQLELRQCAFLSFF
jgi:hypothetical protein